MALPRAKGNLGAVGALVFFSWPLLEIHEIENQWEYNLLAMLQISTILVKKHNLQDYSCLFMAVLDVEVTKQNHMP